MFHHSTIEAETYQTLQTIFVIPEIKKNFALAGGTSLALQLGHRRSIDLDIFSSQPFNTLDIELTMAAHPTIKFDFVNRTNNMLFGYANNVKCDFVYEPSKRIHPFVEHEGINYFHIKDIAAMKMHTICGRGKKKDFFDIYVLIENFGWQQMLSWFNEKYGTSQFYFLWRSITYFNDADEDVDIEGIEPYTKNWKEIKEYIKLKCV
jgi:hypothetical protein